MKKMIAMLVMGGVFAVCTVGCGPTPSTGGTTNVKTDKDKTIIETKDKGGKEVTVDKDKVKVDTKDKDKDK
jgi:hypothetical protein